MVRIRGRLHRCRGGQTVKRTRAEFAVAPEWRAPSCEILPISNSISSRPAGPPVGLGVSFLAPGVVRLRRKDRRDRAAQRAAGADSRIDILDFRAMRSFRRRPSSVPTPANAAGRLGWARRLKTFLRRADGKAGRQSGQGEHLPDQRQDRDRHDDEEGAAPADEAAELAAQRSVSRGRQRDAALQDGDRPGDEMRRGHAR